MNLKLYRNMDRSDGIFGYITDENDTLLYKTLEHSYIDYKGDYSPKLPIGTYTCVRGQHQLHSMKQPFTTFEVTNVPGHVGILFHVGNYNGDSDGCILLGTSVSVMDNGGLMLDSSKVAFDKFMDAQKNCDSFTLEVK